MHWVLPTGELGTGSRACQRAPGPEQGLAATSQLLWELLGAALSLLGWISVTPTKEKGLVTLVTAAHEGEGCAPFWKKHPWRQGAEPGAGTDTHQNYIPQSFLSCQEQAEINLSKLLNLRGNHNPKLNSHKQVVSAGAYTLWDYTRHLHFTGEINVYLCKSL